MPVSKVYPPVDYIELMGFFHCMMSLYVGELQEKYSIIENSKFNKCIYGETHSLKHSLREFKLNVQAGITWCGH